jgi:chromosome segregation ATPase
MQTAESRTALNDLAARCDQYKGWADQRAEQLRQQLALQQQAHAENEHLRQKLTSSMQSVETFRAGFEALKGLAKTNADETARENEALRQKLAEYEREEQSLSAFLKDLSASGSQFLGALEKFKAHSRETPHGETAGPGPAAG